MDVPSYARAAIEAQNSTAIAVVLFTFLWTLASRLVGPRYISRVFQHAFSRGTCTRVVRNRRFSHRSAFPVVDRGAFRHNGILIKAIVVRCGKSGYRGLVAGEANICESEGDASVLGIRSGTDAPAPSIVFSPAQGEWALVESGSRGGLPYTVHVRLSESDDCGSSDSSSRIECATVSVRCKRDAAAIADAFIEDAFLSYSESLVDEFKGKRFIFCLRRIKTHKYFVRMPLTDDKTLDSVYHSSVDGIRRVLDDMINGSGKFAVGGHPKRTTFLLHGPPGCGKTSLVKAIACHAKRHVVTVDLGQIADNNELEDVMCSETYSSLNDDTARVPNDRVVFVLEDVDVSSPAVLRREEQTTAKRAPAAQGVTLSGILNVLDGVHDSPNRIVVITTNRYHALDPALVRPGRVSMVVEMGAVDEPAASRMIGKYFGEETARVVAPLARDARLSPAALEGICGACESELGLIDAIGKAAELHAGV